MHLLCCWNISIAPHSRWGCDFRLRIVPLHEERNLGFKDRTLVNMDSKACGHGNRTFIQVSTTTSSGTANQTSDSLSKTLVPMTRNFGVLNELRFFLCVSLLRVRCIFIPETSKVEMLVKVLEFFRETTRTCFCKSYWKNLVVKSVKNKEWHENDT